LDIKIEKIKKADFCGKIIIISSISVHNNTFIHTSCGKRVDK